MSDTLDLGWWGVVLAVIAGAIRVSTPYLLVSLGETLTEKSGRVNLGLEGTLVLGAMCGFATSYLTGSPWLGLLAAGVSGAALGLLHATICNLPRVNDIDEDLPQRRRRRSDSRRRTPAGFTPAQRTGITMAPRRRANVVVERDRARIVTRGGRS